MKILSILAIVVIGVVLAQPRHVFFNRLDFPKSYQRLGRAAQTQNVNIVLALKQRNLDVLDALFWQVSDPKSSMYGDFMTKDEINKLIAPPQAEIDAVLSWIESHGIEDSSIRTIGDAIQVRMTVAQAEKAFETEMHNFVCTDGRMITKQMGSYSIPYEMSKIVEIVAGLSEFPMPRPDSKKRVNSNAADADVVPQTIWELYNVGSYEADSSSSQGVIEFQDDNPYSKTDLTNFYKEMDITTTAVTHTVGPFSGYFPDTEATLDIQYITAVGLEAENWYWTAEDWMYDFAVDFFNADEIPMVVSMSWGWSEVDQCSIDTTACSTLGVDSQAYVERTNTEFQKIGLRGTTLVSASGDSGANGRTDPFCTDSVLHPIFPGSSPYVTVVGATQLNNVETSLSNPPPICSSYTCASGGEEVAVSYDVSGFTSGGGFSDYLARPSYQDSAVEAFLAKGTSVAPDDSYFNKTGRAYPDVAALGHNFLCLISNEWEPVGGTSAASPTFAGILAILNTVRLQEGQSALGFANQFLYTMSEEHPAAFNDITSGDNICTEYGCAKSCKGFTATSGWDPVTGLGTPNLAEMVSYVKSQS